MVTDTRSQRAAPQSTIAAEPIWANLPPAFDIENLFKAVKSLNDMADAARTAGWSLDWGDKGVADYISLTAVKTQTGNGA